MLAIAKHEFWQLFKSVKSILVVLILVGSAFYVAKNGAELIALFNEGVEDQKIYYSGLSLVLMLFGPLFALALSHDVLNREISGKTLRFLVTRTSRAHILAGKWLGVMGFWVACLIFAYALIIFYARHIEWLLFGQMLLLVLFSVSVAFLLSAVVAKPFVSMFVSTVLGLAIPIASLIVISTDKWWSVFQYVTPYYYMVEDDWKIVAVFGVSAVLMGLTYSVLKRRVL